MRAILLAAVYLISCADSSDADQLISAFLPVHKGMSSFRGRDLPKPRHLKLVCKADGNELATSWELSRFASTFTFFNGNPLGRIFPFLGSKTSVPRPTPQNINSKEIVLWDFANLSQAKLYRCHFF